MWTPWKKHEIWFCATKHDLHALMWMHARRSCAPLSHPNPSPLNRVYCRVQHLSPRICQLWTIFFSIQFSSHTDRRFSRRAMVNFEITWLINSDRNFIKSKFCFQFGSWLPEFHKIFIKQIWKRKVWTLLTANEHLPLLPGWVDCVQCGGLGSGGERQWETRAGPRRRSVHHHRKPPTRHPSCAHIMWAPTTPLVQTKATPLTTLEEVGYIFAHKIHF